jgi:hypothetical protein
LDKTPPHWSSAAPKLWAYLKLHAAALDGRKSSIYRGRARFAMFGIGDYTFSPWKVAISGLHREAMFRLVALIDGKPVVVDDTCYLLPFDTGPQAAIAVTLLQSRPNVGLLRALTFAGAKRPITKRVLQRIDLASLVARSDRLAIIRSATEQLGEPVHGQDLDDWVLGLSDNPALSFTG